MWAKEDHHEWPEDAIHPSRSSASSGRPTGFLGKERRSLTWPDISRCPRPPTNGGATSSVALTGMKADDAKRLKELERENSRLKRIVADKELEIDALREVSRGNW